MTLKKCYFCKNDVNMFDYATGVIPERKTPVVCHTECYMKDKELRA